MSGHGINNGGMSVVGVNLLSPARRARSLRRMLMRRWISGLAMYVMLLAGVSAMVLLSTRVQGLAENELAGVSMQLEQREAEHKQLMSQRNELRKRVNAARAVGYHADWSILLRLIAERRGNVITFDDVSLEHRMELVPVERAADAKGPAPAPMRKEQYELTLIGVGEDVRSVNSFVVALEESELFDRVRRTESNAPDERGTHFRIICVMRDGGETHGASSQESKQ